MSFSIPHISNDSRDWTFVGLWLFWWKVAAGSHTRCCTRSHMDILRKKRKNMLTFLMDEKIRDDLDRLLSLFEFPASQHFCSGPCNAGAMEGYYSRFDSSDLEKALSEDLAGHSTQGAHGLNYHHGPPGDEGQTFFMPCKSIMGQGGTLTALFQLVQQINGNSSYDSTTFCGIPKHLMTFH